ncbi:MAG: hypothetical protein NVS3B5_20780 [Sphingomicrobium sp.]
MVAWVQGSAYGGMIAVDKLQLPTGRQASPKDEKMIVTVNAVLTGHRWCRSSKGSEAVG